ncbi:MAG: hypothetical protein AAF518_23005 [Spirochaetota bacterium]
MKLSIFPMRLHKKLSFISLYRILLSNLKKHLITNQFPCEASHFITEGCFEDNHQCPGGWAQYDQGTRIITETLQEQAEKYPVWQWFAETNKKYLEKGGQIHRLATFLQQEKAEKQGIIIVLANKNYLHAKTEAIFLYKHLQNLRLGVQILDILELLAKLKAKEIPVDAFFYYCYYNDAELKQLCGQEKLEFSVICQELKKFKIQNRFGREGLSFSQRNWIQETGIYKKDTIFQPVIYSETIRERGFSYLNNLDLSSLVLKLETSYGGYGIYFPNQFSLEFIQELLLQKKSFVLETYLQQPSMFQPVFRLTGRCNTRFVHFAEVFIDTRITFLYSSKQEFQRLHVFNRANLEGKPCNLASGGIFLYNWLVPDEMYLMLQHQISEFWSRVSSEQMKSLQDTFHKKLWEKGVIDPNTKIPYAMGLTPYIMSKSSVSRLENYARMWLSCIQKRFQSKGVDKKPFIIALDFSLNPRY